MSLRKRPPRIDRLQAIADPGIVRRMLADLFLAEQVKQLVLAGARPGSGRTAFQLTVSLRLAGCRRIRRVCGRRKVAAQQDLAGECRRVPERSSENLFFACE